MLSWEIFFLYIEIICSLCSNLKAFQNFTARFNYCTANNSDITFCNLHSYIVLHPISSNLKSDVTKMCKRISRGVALKKRLVIANWIIIFEKFNGVYFYIILSIFLKSFLLLLRKKKLESH